MPTVLIVDDNEVAALVVRRTIKAAHPSILVLHAEHGEHAWQAITARNSDFDLVITDVVMPVMGGIELTQKIREIYPRTRVILMGGEGEPREHSAHAFIGKPIDRGTLLATVQKLLAKKQ